MIKSGRRRRTVRQPSRISQLAGLLNGLVKQLTLKRIVLALFVLPLLFYIYREVTHDALIIDPFSVPKGFEETGLTPEVVANRISNALRQIETTAQTRVKRDNLTSLHDEGSTPDVEIPGTKLGLKTLVEVTRAVFGVYPKHVSGDIVVLPGTHTPAAKPQVIVTAYITEGRNKSLAMSLVVDTDDIKVLVPDTAEMILGKVNPYLLAAYKYDHGEFEKAGELLERIVQDPSQKPDHVEAALNLLGRVLFGQKKYVEAVTKYQEALAFDPKDPVIYYNWGLLLSEQQKYGEAVAKYQKAVDLDPKYALAYNNWGNVLYDQQEYGEAISKYRQAVDLDPNLAFAYNNWGLVLYYALPI